jgi:predicted acetyltransferase
LRLVKAALEPPSGLLDMYRELGASENGFVGENVFAEGKQPIREHLQRLVDMAEGRNLRPGWVPMTTHWLLADSDIVIGVSRLRHSLTPGLLNDGGHIGYYVRPAYRGKGYGTKILALTLTQARNLGLERVLLTVRTDNVPSIRVIESSGGAFEDERVDPDTGLPYRRYWIDLTREV